MDSVYLWNLLSKSYTTAATLSNNQHLKNKSEIFIMRQFFILFEAT